MKKFILSLGILFLVLVILLVALVAFLPKLVDTQAFRDQITQQVKERTGQDLSIRGDLSISIYPWLGLRTGEITLSQPPVIGLDKPALLSVSHADISVKLLPLLKKKVEINTIVLQQPIIHYIQTAQGTSLDGFAGETQANAQTPSTTTPQDQANLTASPLSIAALAIAGVSLSDGNVTFDDQLNGQQHRLEDLQFETGNLLAGANESIALSARALLHEQAPIDVDLKSQGQVNIAEQLLTLSDVVLNIKQNDADINASIEQAQFNAERVQLSALELQANTGQLMSPALNPVVLVSALEWSLATNQSSVIPFNINEKSLGLRAVGDVQLEKSGDNITYKGQLSVDNLEPLALMKKFAIDYQPQNNKALKAFSFGSEFNGSSNGISLQALALQLDQSRVKGSLSILRFDAPQYRFDLALDGINIDDYLPPTSDADASNNSGGNAGALLIPVAIFKDLNANGVFRADLIQAAGIKLQKLAINIASNTKTVNIKPKAELYGGTLGGELIFEESSSTVATLTVAPVLNNVALGDLLKDADITDQISGRGSVNSNIVITDQQGKQTNKGTIAVSLKEGAIKTIDIQEIINDAQDDIDKLKGKAIESRSKTRSETRFAEMTASFVLNNFILSNNDLLMKAPAFRVDGKGKIDLQKQQLDYLTNVAIVKTNEGQGGKDRGDLEGLNIPVEFSGDLTEPKYKIDIVKVIQANSKKDIVKEKEQLIEDVKKNILNKLFK